MHFALVSAVRSSIKTISYSFWLSVCRICIVCILTFIHAHSHSSLCSSTTHNSAERHTYAAAAAAAADNNSQVIQLIAVRWWLIAYNKKWIEMHRVEPLELNTVRFSQSVSRSFSVYFRLLHAARPRCTHPTGQHQQRQFMCDFQLCHRLIFWSNAYCVSHSHPLP